VFFTRVLYAIEDVCDGLWHGPEWLRPAAGGVLLGLLLLVLPVGRRPAGAAAAATLRLELLETSFSDLRHTISGGRVSRGRCARTCSSSESSMVCSSMGGLWWFTCDASSRPAAGHDGYKPKRSGGAAAGRGPIT